MALVPFLNFISFSPRTVRSPSGITSVIFHRSKHTGSRCGEDPPQCVWLMLWLREETACAICQKSSSSLQQEKGAVSVGRSSLSTMRSTWACAGENRMGFCYKVLLGSLPSDPASLEFCWAASCARGSAGSVQPAASSAGSWFSSEGEVAAEAGFRLITRSSLFPDSAIRGTTKQQSKSLVRTWLICNRQNTCCIKLTNSFRSRTNKDVLGRLSFCCNAKNDCNRRHKSWSSLGWKRKGYIWEASKKNYSVRILTSYHFCRYSQVSPLKLDRSSYTACSNIKLNQSHLDF